MKKKYIKPSLRIVELDACDLITTSVNTDDNSFGPNNGRPDARERNPIWEDYE